MAEGSTVCDAKFIFGSGEVLLRCDKTRGDHELHHDRCGFMWTWPRATRAPGDQSASGTVPVRATAVTS
jgi:hypothetical protein